jgi:CRP/FNR family transcriptional regulator, cyclic AMP receptor protein
MIGQTPQAQLIRRKLLDSLRQKTSDAFIVKIAKHANIYTCGDVGACSIYLIECGQVKLLTQSDAGKEGIVAIHTAGDVFGELCLSGTGERVETATAMEDTELRVVSCPQLFSLLRSDSLLAQGLVRYLSVRIAEQQEAIAHLATDSSEHRLGTTLLELARRLGKKEPYGLSIEHRISHQELANIVGTTRPRVSEFLQRFRELGLIETHAQHCLVVRDKELSDYLTQLAPC